MKSTFLPKPVAVNEPANLPARVAQAIAQRRLFPRGATILVAVSGGLDSMVLLHLLAQMAPKNRWRLMVAHFNHQLRGRSSDADERLVKRTAEKFKLPFVAGRGDVQAVARREKLSLEMAARKLRHAFFAKEAARRKIRRVALAHHAEDQVELFFLRLLRGAGAEGLAGMKWQNPSPADPDILLMRPLLEQSKSALAAYANAMRVPFREDASNARLDIQRNHIRHKLLPVLRKHQPALERVILRQMEMLAADAEFVTQAAKDWMDVAEKGALRRPCRRAKRQATEQQGPGFPSAYSHPHHLFQSVGKPPHPNPLPQGGRGGRRRASSATDLKTSSPAFDNLPVAVQRRCLQLQLARAGIAVEFALVEHLRVSPHRPISVPAGKHGTEHATRNTVSIVRDESGLLQICKLIKAAFVDSRQNARLEGAAGQITQGKVRITWKKMLMSTGIFRAPKAVENCEIFDAATVGSDIVVRYWLPGDRFQPIGMKKPVKLQDLFTNAKIPREKRRQLLVGVTASGEIFWVEGLRIAERFKLDKKSVYGLKWAWERVE